MKKKSKAVTRSKIARVSPKADIISDEKIPPGLEFLAGIKNPSEAILEFWPAAKNLDALAGISSGFQNDLKIEVPEWVRAASQKFWESVGLNLSASLETGHPADVGKMVGLIEFLPLPKNKQLKSKAMEKIASYFSQVAKLEAANASPEISKQFFDERIKGKEILQKIECVQQRTKIYMLIAAAWRVIEKFSSTGEFHKWLLSQKEGNGKKFIAPKTDSREIRKICKSIGLEFKNKWRKPKVKIPATVSDTKAGLSISPQSRP